MWVKKQEKRIRKKLLQKFKAEKEKIKEYERNFQKKANKKRTFFVSKGRTDMSNGSIEEVVASNETSSQKKKLFRILCCYKNHNDNVALFACGYRYAKSNR